LNYTTTHIYFSLGTNVAIP